jgi:hypothetical protein
MFAGLLLGAVGAAGQTGAPAASVATASRAVAAAPAQVAPAESATPRMWEFSAGAMVYFLPASLETDDFVLPTVTADRGWLHLEARYNYEAIGAGSAWFGVNFGGGRNVTWTLTPMIGAVFGSTDGVAPGYRGSLAWRRLELSSEGEYVFDAANSEDSFFYNWSELTYAPAEWFRFGVATQRTRLYQTEHDIQRGLIVGFTWNWLDLAGYLFNPDDSKPVVLVSARVTF